MRKVICVVMGHKGKVEIKDGKLNFCCERCGQKISASFEDEDLSSYYSLTKLLKKEKKN